MEPSGCSAEPLNTQPFPSTAQQQTSCRGSAGNPASLGSPCAAPLCPVWQHDPAVGTPGLFECWVTARSWGSCWDCTARSLPPLLFPHPLCRFPYQQCPPGVPCPVLPSKHSPKGSRHRAKPREQDESRPIAPALLRRQLPISANSVQDYFFSQDLNWEMAVMIPTCQEGATISALRPVLVSNTL